MEAVEIKDAKKKREILSRTALLYIPHLAELETVGESAVSLYGDDAQDPANFLAVRWGAGPLGWTHVVQVNAAQVQNLPEVLSALPRGEGTYEFLAPFWAAAAVDAVFRTELQGPWARYRLEPQRLNDAPASGQVTPLDQRGTEAILPLFPSIDLGRPKLGLILQDELVACAATTHVYGRFADIFAFTVEEHRGRGFGRGVLSAICRALLAEGLTASVLLNLADAPAVAMLERTGFVQHASFLRLTGIGRR